MPTSLERIRAKITELEAKLTNLRITERELIALEPAPARKRTTPRAPKLKSMRREKAAPPARQTIGAAIAEVLKAHGALPAAGIAEHIKAGGREIGKRTISHSLQALKKQGRVRIRGGKWMLPKARSKAASAS
jgi:ribosomal protein L9